MAGEIGGVLFKVLLLIGGIMVIYNLIFDPSSLHRIPHDISNYVNSWTHNGVRHK